MAVPQELIYAMAALTFAGAAAVTDVRERRIPNKLVLTSIVTGVVLHGALGGFSGIGSALLAALIAGGIFMVFHLAGGMGAGDVKLMAGLGCLSATSDVKNLLITTMITGAVFALALAARRGALRRTAANLLVLAAHHQQNGMAAHPELNVSNQKMLRLPYAVPMAAACGFVLALHLLHGVRP